MPEINLLKENKILEKHIKHLYEQADVELYYKLNDLANSNTALKDILDIVENQEIIQKYKDVNRATKFRDNAKEFDLDQKNYFLSVCLLLLLPEVQGAYQYCIEKAEAEIFRYRFCYDKDFINNLKKQENLTDEELNKKYTCDKSKISILNLQTAVMAFDEAIRYSKTVEEINYIDERIQQVIEFYYEQRNKLIANNLKKCDF